MGALYRHDVQLRELPCGVDLLRAILTSTDREMGQVLEGLKHLEDGQAHLESLMLRHFQAFSDRLQKHEESVDERFENVTNRIRKLETWRAWMAGIGAAIAGALGFHYTTK